MVSLVLALIPKVNVEYVPILSQVPCYLFYCDWNFIQVDLRLRLFYSDYVDDRPMIKERIVGDIRLRGFNKVQLD